MSGFDRKARAYILLVAPSGGAVLVWTSLTAPVARAVLAPLALFTIICCVAETFPIQLPRGDQMTVSTAVSFSTLLLFGPTAAICQTAVASVVGDLVQRKAWYRVLFNVGQYSLTLGLTGFVYHAAHGVEPLLGSLRSAGAIAIAGTVFFFVNSSLVSLVIALTSNLPFGHVWLDTQRNLFLSVGAMLCIGVLIAVIWEITPVGVLFLSLPTAAVYMAVRVIFDLLRQSRAALLELADTLDERDPFTARHTRRVAQYAEKIALELGLPEQQVEIITMAAHLHDLGKMTIPDELLHKRGPISEQDRRELDLHAGLGARFLSHFSQFRAGADIVRRHHERYDGTGYPDGLRGDAIPIGARIVAVADAYDAMISDRPYRPALTPSAAMHEIIRGIGKQFDPMVAAAFLKTLERDESIGVGTEMQWVLSSTAPSPAARINGTMQADPSGAALRRNT